MRGLATFILSDVGLLTLCISFSSPILEKFGFHYPGDNSHLRGRKVFSTKSLFSVLIKSRIHSGLPVYRSIIILRLLYLISNQRVHFTFFGKSFRNQCACSKKNPKFGHLSRGPCWLRQSQQVFSSGKKKEQRRTYNKCSFILS